jgi:purine catabolism regulator
MGIGPLTVAELAGLTTPGMHPRAGTAGLGREVTWVASTEYLAPTDWLRGGEFMMMGGWNFRPSGASMRNYVRRLSDFGLSGLGFAVGFRFKTVPEPILEEGERLGFAVLEIPFELAFADIARAAAEVLFERGRGSLAAMQREHIEIAGGLVRGTVTIGDVLMKVASYLRGSVVLYDGDGNSTSTSHFARERRVDPARVRKIERQIDPQGSARIEIAREDDRLSEIESFFLDEVCLALSFDFARRRAIEQTRLQLEADLLDEIARGTITVERARSKFVAFGLDPARRFGAVVVREAVQPDRMKLAVGRVLSGLASGAIAARRPLSYDMILEAPTDEALQRIGESLVRAVPGATVGLGRVGPLEFLGQSLTQARHLAQTKRVGLISVEELGASELLMAIDRRFAQSYVDRVLGDMRDEALCETVAVLLGLGFNWNAAAAALGLHRHTLRFRARKFADATGIDLDDPRQRLEVWLALEARRIFAAAGSAV